MGQISYADGVKFPASQVASSDANTLDDYEEGTWTPVIDFGGNHADQTWTVHSGYYTKVGNLVTISGYIILTEKGSSSGSAAIGDLPFLVYNSGYARAGASPYFDAVTFANQYQSYFLENTDTIPLIEVTEAGVTTALTENDFADTSTILIGGTYRTA